MKKVHIMRWAVQDWRTSRVRARSAMTGDPMLRTVYLEALWALHEHGGELPADPDALADELMLPAEEIARCLPILDALGRRPGARGGLVVEGGLLRNVRVTEDLRETRNYLAEQADFGKASAEARRSKLGTAQPKAKRPSPEGRPAPAEGTFGIPSDAPEGDPEEPSGSLEGLPNLPLPLPLPSHCQERNPPNPPAAAGGPAARQTHVGDQLPDGRTVLEVDDLGPVVVAKPEPRRPGEGEIRSAVDRIVAVAVAAGVPPFDRGGRRRIRERLLGGETEAQLRESYARAGADYRAQQLPPLDAGQASDFHATIAAIRARTASPAVVTSASTRASPPPDTESPVDDEDERQALRLVGAGGRP